MKNIYLHLIIIALITFSCEDLLNPSDNSNSSKPDGNDKFSSASSYNVEQTMTFKIDYDSDVDYFKFNIKKSGLYFLTVSNIPNSIDLFINIYDKECTEVAHRPPYMGDGEIVSLGTLLEIGEYYLKINAAINVSSKQEMTFVVNRDLVDTFELNDTYSAAYNINLNNYYRPKIFPASDKDYFSFTLDRNQIIRIQVDSVSSRTVMTCKLYGDENNEINYRYPINNTVPLDWGISLIKGTYVLQFNAGYGEYSSEHAYRFIIKPDTTDPTEWNNDTASAFPLLYEQPIYTAIYPSGDIDFYTFTLDTADTILIEADSISTNLSKYTITVLNDEMKVMAQSLHPENCSVRLKIGLNAGKYFLDINCGSVYMNQVSFKRYKLKISKGSV